MIFELILCEISEEIIGGTSKGIPDENFQMNPCSFFFKKIRRGVPVEIHGGISKRFTRTHPTRKNII